MLSETFKYLTTPCAPHLKSMGYLRELIALEARYQRCRTAWQPHIENTQSVIADAVAATRQHKKVVVLGAGILSDIPIKILSDSFETVLLVDVCFLNQAKNLTQQYTNVVYQTTDIMGVAASLYAGEIPIPSIPGEISLTDIDLVISANILSQLPLIPISYLQNTQPQLSEEKVMTFGCDLITNHLAYLETCPGTVCLISEIERQFCDEDRVIEIEDPLCGYDLNLDGKEWLWDLAPKGEIPKDFAIQNRIIGAHWDNKK